MNYAMVIKVPFFGTRLAKLFFDLTSFLGGGGRDE